MVDSSSSFNHISCLTIQNIERVFGLIALVAQVLYGENESEGNTLIVDNDSTHHMNGHHNEFST